MRLIWAGAVLSDAALAAFIIYWIREDQDPNRTSQLVLLLLVIVVALNSLLAYYSFHFLGDPRDREIRALRREVRKEELRKRLRDLKGEESAR